MNTTISADVRNEGRRATNSPAFEALARMYRGMHHPTDVTAGLLIGVGCILVALTAARVAGAAARRSSPA